MEWLMLCQEFQQSNAESFNKLLLGIHGMPVNAIVQFTFYKLVAWFNDIQPMH